MLELTTIQEVREAATNGTKALKDLLQGMESLDQGKIPTNEFERARDAIECSVCLKAFNSESDLEDGKCRKCRIDEEKEKKAEAARKQLEQNWKSLVDELNKEAGSEIYVLNNVIIRREDGDLYCNIYRDPIYNSRYSYRPSGHALRINTNDYNIKANRLKKDFGAKSLAAGLHKKCDELLEKMKTKIEKRIEKKEYQETTRSLITKTFGIEDGIIENEYGKKYGRGGSVTTDYHRIVGYVFKYEGLTIRTLDGKEYYVSGLVGKRLTVSQIKKLAEFIDSL